MSVNAYLGMIKNLFSKLIRKQEVTPVDTNTSQESEEQNLKKSENDL
jgi:hypothetical protein